MTKISTYIVDDKVTALDKWIGSDANMQNKTKNFTPKKLAAYFNEDQVINIGTPLQYKYYTLDPLEARPNGTLTFETEIGPTVNFSSVTTFILSKYTTKQNIVSEYLNFLDGCKVLLFKSSDINSFGFYRISGIAIYDEDPNFFTVTVDYETGNGFMQEDNDYMISLVSLPGGAIPTKTSELINDGEDGVNPFISELDINREEWDAAYEGKINNAEVTGTTTKTLTLTKQDGSTIEASWTDDNTDAVTSVFGRTGDVVAESGDYTTDQVTEVADKKYQTDLQDLYNDATSSIQDQLDGKQGLITLTTTGTSGAATLVGDTLNIPQYSVDLSGYVPYTGATQDVNLGLNQLKADSLAVSTTSTESVDVAEIVWNSSDGTFDMGLLNGVTLQAGQEMNFYGKASGAIADGQAVMFAGSEGDHILMSVATQSAINANPEYFIGVATQDFTNNQFGYVTVFGKVRNLNTTGYSGAVLYFDSIGALPGALTSVMPPAPNAKIIVAAVIRVHATQGILMVRPHTMPKVNDIQDIYAPTPTNNYGLFWNTATLRYENNSIIGALGYTPYNATNPSNYISLLDLSSTAIGLSYNNATGVFSLTSGYVIPTTTEETNWDTAYSNRIISSSSPLSIAANNISISQAGASSDGYLSSSDWNVFNNKQAAGNYITSLTGEATASGPGSSVVTLTNSAVTGKVLTGVNITGGTVVATDSILTAFGKVQNQINGLIGGSIFQSTWDASTNTPTLTSSVGTKGYYYIVSVAGSTNLDGITDWKVGDWAIYDGTSWQKVDNTDAVSSVNGFTGAVSLTTSDIPEGPTNFYYTDSRVSSNSDVAANTAARHNAVTIGTANGLSLSTQVLSLGLASSSANGALSSTDWNNFNGKQSALSGTGFVKISGTTISYDNNTYALDDTVVHKTGDETITGRKTFNSATDIGIRSNNSGSGWGIYTENSSTGIANYIANNGSGKGFVIANALSSFGNMFEGSYNGTTNFFVNYLGGGYFASKVGIGTNAPNYGLNVVSSTLADAGIVSNQFVGVRKSNNTLNGYLALLGGDNGENAKIIGYNSSGTQTFEINASSSATYFNGGNFGIGTSSPSSKLTVNGRTDFWSNGYGWIHFDSSSANQYLASIKGSDTFMLTTGKNGANNQPALLFGTSDVERMRITSGGQVQITQGGQTYSDGLRIISGGNRWTKVISGSNMILGYNESDRGSFSSSTGIYTSLSDRNKKKDFEESSMGLNEILNLKPTLYRMLTDDENEPKQLGFIAQEVNEFIPQAYVEIGEEDNKFIGLNHIPIIATLVNAIKEQNEFLVQLKAEIDLLKQNV